MMRLRIASAAAALAIVAGLAGCSSTTLDAATADQLQESVVAVADAAAAGDAEGAVAQLDELQAQLDAAMAADLVSAARAARVQTAINVVRTDLEALVPTPEPEPEPSPSETEPADDNGGDNGGGGNDDGGGNDNSGPGNNNGNDGNGNGKGKDD